MRIEEERMIYRIDESYKLAVLQVKHYEDLIKEFHNKPFRNRREYLEVLKEGYSQSMEYMKMISALYQESKNIYQSSREYDSELTLFG